MSTEDEPSLEQRALAAAAQERAEREAREEASRRAAAEWAAQRKAKEEWEARSRAASELEKILGHRTSPHDWGIGTTGGLTPSTFATITLLGVEIRGGGRLMSMRVHNQSRSADMWGGWTDLTLATFGEALQHRKSQEP
jgi:hypothetical protein